MPAAVWMIGLLVSAYLVGAIPFGYLVAKLRGVDILKEGSGNIGATNVARVLGKKFGILVFLLDFAKGAGPVAVAAALTSALEDMPEWWRNGWPEVGAGLAAFLGHLFPLYLKFHGGKGVATGAGVVAVLMPLATLGAVLAWIAVLAMTRYVSLASLAAAVVLCVLYFAGAGEVNPADPRALFCVLACGLVFARHRANIGRLMRGEESKVNEGGTMRQLAKIIHVLALGLWFGSCVFFTFVVGLSLFGSFESLDKRTRPEWFPLPRQYAKTDANIDGPREQGVRAAGFAVAPMFTWYFLIQGVCGLLASATAIGWAKAHPTEKVHRWRNVVLLLALVTVVIGWPLERHVSALREPRNSATDFYLQSRSANQAAADAMAAARAELGRWHAVSLLTNFATVILVTAGMAMAPRLPRD